MAEYLVPFLTFIAGAGLGGISAGLIVLAAHERAARHAIERRLTEIERELGNLARVARNRLYKECLEDKQAQLLQAALRLRTAQRDVEDALAILDIGTGKTKGAKQ